MRWKVRSRTSFYVISSSFPPHPSRAKSLDHFFTILFRAAHLPLKGKALDCTPIKYFRRELVLVLSFHAFNDPAAQAFFAVVQDGALAGVTAR